ncbi:MAG: protein-L-isoaspartate O-methyltransferase [Proteobacteria bacterium]|nr:protein-L-isoaspartate O-methyltransferase [Pseudomonadota bacterium]
MNFDKARHNMVTQQVRAWDVVNKDILNAMLNVQREEFVPVSQRKLAFADMALPIGHDQHMMKPVVEGRLLQVLDLKPGDRVLEVGTGSGYLTALLATLTDHVHSIDIYQDFIDATRQKLSDQGIEEVTLEQADFFEFKAPIKYDHIILTGSMKERPDFVFDWLKDGGQVFVIVGEDPVMEARIYTTPEKFTSHFDTMVAPMIQHKNTQPFNL